MHDNITIIGTVGTEPSIKVLEGGLPISSFRLASTERRRTDQGWENGDTNWYSVTCFRSLANNVRMSVEKGQRVIVHGRLQLSEYVPQDGVKRIRPEIIATSVGHDLTFTKAHVVREASGNGSTNDGAPSAGAATTSDDAQFARPEPDAAPDAEFATAGIGAGLDGEPPF